MFIMIFLKIILLLIVCMPALGNDYDGPLAPGLEKFTCGEYSIRGQIVEMRGKDTLRDKNHKSFFLKLYPKTTREFNVPIEGKNLWTYYRKSKPYNLALEVIVLREGVGPEAKLRLKNYIGVVTESDVLKYSVRKKFDSKCPES